MFRVRWTRAASNQLANIWLNAPNQQAVTNASYRVDQLLQNDPETEGEQRDNGRRILFVVPLAAIYRVNTDTKVVTVVSVLRYGRV